MGHGRCGNSFSDVGVFPLRRLGSLLIEANVAQDLASEVGDRGEDAAVDDIAPKFGEPAFDLIQPGRIGRREVKAYIGMLIQKLLCQFGFVSGKVVQDHMYLSFAEARWRLHLEATQQTLGWCGAEWSDQ